MSALLTAPESTRTMPSGHPAPRADWSARALFDAALACGMPVALWRLPQVEPLIASNEGAVEGIVALGQPAPNAGVDFLQGQAGFVFAPFSDRGAGLFLRDDVRLVGGGLFVNPHATGNAECLLAEYATRLESSAQAPVAWHTTAEPSADRAAPQAEFEALVADAIRFIRQAGIAKVVVSRTAPVELPDTFHPAELFAALCARYPHAFVSLVSAPGVGTWLGASPELLLGLDNEALTTVALAGTQKRNGVPIERIVWGRKEQVEQEMVSAYVRGFFAGAGVVEPEEQGPLTVAAGGVVHLQSQFRVALPEAERLRLANRVLMDLHPTSAVCGMPRREALAFIQAREGYDRAFYSGYLGPVHVDGRSALYVNLRCMQLRCASSAQGHPFASLYVGAGITADSDPAAEWRETELKARTILDALHIQPGSPAVEPATAVESVSAVESVTAVESAPALHAAPVA